MKFLNNIQVFRKVVAEFFERSDGVSVVFEDNSNLHSHSNKQVLDNLGDEAGSLTYQGLPISSGGGNDNLTDTSLVLGNYRIEHNATEDSLDYTYIG